VLFAEMLPAVARWTNGTLELPGLTVFELPGALVCSGVVPEVVPWTVLDAVVVVAVRLSNDW